MSDLPLCYVCRKVILPSEKRSVKVTYSSGYAAGASNSVPVHGSCKKGSSILQTPERILWEK